MPEAAYVCPSMIGTQSVVLSRISRIEDMILRPLVGGCHLDALCAVSSGVGPLVAAPVR